MTSPTTPEQLAAECEESAQAWANEIDTRVKAAAMLRTLSAELAQARAELEGLKAQSREIILQQSVLLGEYSKSLMPDDPDMQELASIYKQIDALFPAPPTGEV